MKIYILKDYLYFNYSDLDVIEYALPMINSNLDMATLAGEKQLEVYTNINDYNSLLEYFPYASVDTVDIYRKKLYCITIPIRINQDIDKNSNTQHHSSDEAKLLIMSYITERIDKGCTDIVINHKIPNDMKEVFIDNGFTVIEKKKNTIISRRRIK